jgi:hypothetical protein
MFAEKTFLCRAETKKDSVGFVSSAERIFQIRFYLDATKQYFNSKTGAYDGLDELVKIAPIELLSYKKELIFNNQSYFFVHSKIFPSKSHSTPILADYFSREGNHWIVVFRAGEYFRELVFYQPSSEIVTTSLSGSEDDTDWIDKKFGDIQLLVEESVKYLKRSDEPMVKVVGFNLNLSPGHYLEDELPFSYLITKYFSEDIELEVLHVRGLGIEVQKNLRRLARRFERRCDLYSYVNSRTLNFVPSLARGIGPEHERITYFDLASISDLRIRDIDGTKELLTKIYFAFGLRAESRDGLFFRVDGPRLKELCDCLSSQYFQLRQVEVDFEPIIDCSILDSDSEVLEDPLSQLRLLAEKDFINDAATAFGKYLRTTYKMNMFEKISQLQICSFGLYPFGSGGQPFHAFFNEKPYFNHNHPTKAEAGSPEYFNIMWSVANDRFLNFDKDNMYPTPNCVVADGNSWEIKPKDMSLKIISTIYDGARG